MCPRTHSTGPAIETRALRRTFRVSPRTQALSGQSEVEALASMDLRIESGEIFGMLGPNGAGKTTCIKILTTLLLPTAGEARVAGFDAVREPNEVRRRISLVSGGETSGYGVLTVRECLWMYSQFYGVPGQVAWPRVDRLIEIVDLKTEQHTRINRLSTGQRQRMNFARGFVSDPEVLFLDEPTLGMDVNAARTLRAFVAEWVREREGRTVLLTTHYMAEAEALCDRVAIIDRGHVLACDSTPALRRRVQGGQHVELEVLAPNGVTLDLTALTGVAAAWGAPHPERGTRTLKFRLPEGGALVEVLRRLEQAGARVDGIATRETTLEDVFIAVVGRTLDDSGSADDSRSGGSAT
ncbi:MAG: ABC transporter ATP-binding protein [Candidatus Eisenbacteria bacterium]|nr:ABC transporter ATP-binding protein [Candidatus Eisenbacteria bacterium]